MEAGLREGSRALDPQGKLLLELTRSSKGSGRQLILKIIRDQGACIFPLAIEILSFELGKVSGHSCHVPIVPPVMSARDDFNT